MSAHESVFAAIAAQAARSGQRPALKVQDGDRYVPTTYAELVERVRAIGTGLLELGVRRGERLGLIADNRPEWILADLATVGIGAVDVPRGADTPARELEYILQHSTASGCFVEDLAQLKKLESIAAALPALRLAIILDPTFPPPSGRRDPEASDPQPLPRLLQSADVGSLRVLPLAAVEARGRALLAAKDRRFDEALARVAPQDLLTIIYTSGTTGRPKGVELTHRNALYQMAELPGAVDARSDDRWLVILPPWHVFERAVEYGILVLGASMAYAKPLRNQLLEALRIERPTMMAAVPRVLEAIHDGVMKQVRKEGAVKRTAFELLLEASRRAWRAELILEGRHPDRAIPGIKDEVVRRVRAKAELELLGPARRFAQARLFSKIRAKTGGELRCIISGGAKLPSHLDEFYHAVGIPILEGYGLTETAPVVAVRSPGRSAPFTVGHPLPQTLVEVLDDDGRPVRDGTPGHVTVRGPGVMRGYHRDEELTGAVLSGTGRFDTGDLGVRLPGGEIVLTGRAKDVIVLMSGEKVEPEALEARLKRSPLIAHVFVAPQDDRALCALIVPAFDALAERLGREVQKGEVESQELRSIFKAEVARLLPDQDLKPYERLRRVKLLPDEFRVGEELTATLKVKRDVVRERYQAAIAGAE